MLKNASQIRTLLKAGNIEEAKSLLQKHIRNWNTNTKQFTLMLRSMTPVIASLPKAERDELEKIMRQWEINNPNLGERLYNMLRQPLSDSYRIQRAAIYGVKGDLLPSLITPKINGRKFARILGLALPKTYQENVSVDHLQVELPSVVKPANEDGGRAVYGLVPENGKLVNKFKGEIYGNIEDFKNRLRNHLEDNYVSRDAWIVEELLDASDGHSFPPDVKFYAFYGRVGYILQVDRWTNSKPSYSFFNVNKDLVDTGKYPIPPKAMDPLFSDDDVEMASEVSAKIPWPAVRIDFFSTNRGLVFGEFTLNPGAAGSFNTESDTFLGRLWVRAEAKLFEDVAMGREFTEYWRFLEVLGKR